MREREIWKQTNKETTFDLFKTIFESKNDWLGIYKTDHHQDLGSRNSKIPSSVQKKTTAKLLKVKNKEKIKNQPCGADTG